jgi:hypothetical protein
VAAHRDLHVGKLDLGSVAQLVAPCERGLVDRDARLGEEPLGEAIVAAARALVERLVGEIDEAILAAAQRQRGTVDVDVVEAHLAHGERPPREDDVRALDGKRGAPAAIGHVQALEGERRAQAAPAAFDALHGNRGAGGLLETRDDVPAVIVHRRKRDVAQPQDQGREGDDQERRGARCQAQDDAR